MSLSNSKLMPVAWGSILNDGTVRQQFGVAVTKTGTGAYLLTFNDAMANVNYAVIACGEGNSRAQPVISTKTTTTCVLNTYNSSTLAATDYGFDFVVFGDKANEGA